MSLFSGTIHTLENSLNYATAKNRVIAQNLANIDTPNYKAKDVAFKKVLSDALDSPLQARQTNSKHIPFNQESTSVYQTVTNSATSYNHNGNSVDVDKEMSELAENQIYYQALTDRINGKFNSLQTALRGGS
ncbi:MULTISPECIES: flagellar basal body rod protein FlgB [Virgibacillus]|uniref:Flagellar basal body rod protein FlgB n=2 Tax=Virgibacillus TaxID=84406 RepID=A0A024QDU6_9BACI|nr:MULTISPECIES: flagellar basal body rod protein FlgB [Virgibacillus]EQB36423.1 hypothetical protein M948_15440 [Virgibacillus sp. CM-4]MYL42256.1 flagellar basal body rod protein FlgB [Virgibacillus massiliensis]GGJ44005.1 flagellar basal body rod protein FlgB [Virgibacillus kapii]CDQ40121.1 Flagellar basal body rod protein FlgB [Virgibacillus massiliensis]